jgi:hypothetical protein
MLVESNPQSFPTCPILTIPMPWIDKGLAFARRLKAELHLEQQRNADASRAFNRL